MKTKWKHLTHTMPLLLDTSLKSRYKNLHKKKNYNNKNHYASFVVPVYRFFDQCIDQILHVLSRLRVVSFFQKIIWKFVVTANQIIFSQTFPYLTLRVAWLKPNIHTHKIRNWCQYHRPELFIFFIELSIDS